MTRKLTLILAAACLAALLLSPALPARAMPPALGVYYAGPEGSLKTALTLTGDLTAVADPALADVIVLNGALPPDLDIYGYAQEGKGFLIIPGPGLPAEALRPLLSADLNFTPLAEPLSLIPAREDGEPLLDQIIWTSAPQVRERVRVTGAELEPLVSGYETGETVFGRARAGEAAVYLFTARLDEANPQIQQWAYFNYWVYAAVSQAGGREPLAFGDYRGSPVPQPGSRAALLAACAGMLILSFSSFFLVRRYSRRHPELLDSIVVNRGAYEKHQAATRWDEVGFHRPLGGFLLALMLGFIFFIPLIIYQNLILPVYILPSAQALGIWGRVVQLFNVLWLLFDMGTSAAFIKFFSEYRVSDPKTGIKFGQVFVWWQLLSGAFQVALVTLTASLVLPHSPYAIYAWSIIVHALIQIPGFYGLYRHALPANQRFDYAQMVDMAKELVLPVIVQPIFVSLMILWGRNHPIFGPSMGGLIGLGISAYVVELLTFCFGFLLNRRLGYSNRLLFLAHFDWTIIKQSFRFGVFEMLGSIAWAGGQAMEILITQAKLVNYAEIWGNWGLAQNFIYAFNVLAILYNNLMPSISEAISNARRKLSMYYSAMAYKYGGIISAYIGAILLAVADRFILGASGPEFTRAAVYAVPLIIWGAVQYPSWVGDNVQLGSNRPYLKSVMVLSEQIIRITLAFFLVERLQVAGLVVAYFIGLLAKGISVYFINNRLCYRQRFYFWQSLAAPLLAGAAHFAILRWLTGLIWQGDQVTSIIIFFIGILPSYPLFMFLYGLFGGWDDGTLDELAQGARLAGIMKPLAWLFWKATALGARISPLHGRFPITIRAEALEEARSLTRERVELT